MRFAGKKRFTSAAPESNVARWRLPAVTHSRLPAGEVASSECVAALWHRDGAADRVEAFTWAVRK
jgi:hypothetical protein